MTEDEARALVADCADVSRETWGQLERFVALIRDESERQNLVAKSTLDIIWQRHILDSAQLLLLAPQAGDWADLGSGPGLPGLVIAIMRDAPMTLIEERAVRTRFLAGAVESLNLSSRVTIRQSRAERVKDGPFAVLSARAFAPLDRLFELAAHLSTEKTRWLLPKGRGGAMELAAAKAGWRLDFTSTPSLTDPESAILQGRLLGRKQAAGAHRAPKSGRSAKL